MLITKSKLKLKFKNNKTYKEQSKRREKKNLKNFKKTSISLL